MDPVTAFSLACGILQIVDFSAKVVSACRAIYRNGSLSEHAQLEERASHLKNLHHDLKSPNFTSSGTDPTRKLDTELVELAEKCSDTAENLIHEVQALMVKDPRRKSKIFKKTWKALRKMDALHQIETQLAGYQKILDTKLLVRVRYVKLGEVRMLALPSLQRLAWHVRSPG